MTFQVCYKQTIIIFSYYEIALQDSYYKRKVISNLILCIQQKFIVKYVGSWEI